MGSLAVGAAAGMWAPWSAAPSTAMAKLRAASGEGWLAAVWVIPLSLCSSIFLNTFAASSLHNIHRVGDDFPTGPHYQRCQVKLSKTWVLWTGQRAQVSNQTKPKHEEMQGGRSVRPGGQHLKEFSFAVHRPMSESQRRACKGPSQVSSQPQCILRDCTEKRLRMKEEWRGPSSG